MGAAYKKNSREIISYPKTTFWTKIVRMKSEVLD